MSNLDLLSSKILSNKDILIEIYSILKDVAEETVNDPTVIAQKNNVCLLQLNNEGIMRTRSRERCRISTQAEVTYNPEALTIIGGAALNLYDFKLEGYRVRKNIPELQKLIKKSTADLDMVWWPDFKILDPSIENKYAAISESVAIETVASVFTIKLREKFREIENSALMNVISEMLEGPTTVSVINRHTFPAGVWNIECTFTANATQYKIIEIALHDTGAGQRYDQQGFEIKELLPMYNDPVYTTTKPNTPTSIQKLQFGDVSVSVCNLLQFYRQQLFAFTLLSKSINSKAIINYKRIIYIIVLLNNIQPSNSRNMSILKDIFGIETNKERIGFIDAIIGKLLNIISSNYNELITIYEGISDKDRVLNELYIVSLKDKLRYLSHIYNNKLMEAEGPLRKIKKMSGRMDKKNIDALRKKATDDINNIQKEFNTVKSEIQANISRVQSNSSNFLNTISTVNSRNGAQAQAPIQVQPVNYAYAKGHNTRKNYKKPNVKSSLPPLVPQYAQPPPPRYAQPPPLRYEPPSHDYYPEYSTSTASTSYYEPPPLPPPPRNYRQQPPKIYSSILNDPSIPKSRLLYNKSTHTYSVADALHNRLIEVIFDAPTGMYYTYDPTTTEYNPLYYDDRLGIYYPVYYFKSLGTMAYYNDSDNTKVPIRFDPRINKYQILQGIKSSRGGNKTRKNKSK